MNKEAAIQLASEYIKKWELLGWKTPTGGSYTPDQAKNIPYNTTLYPYPDGKGYSIGWGTYNTLRTNGQKIVKGTRITKVEADQNLDAEIRNNIVPYFNKNITADLTENQYAALISLAYNAGPASIKYNGLLDAINSYSPNVVNIWEGVATTDQRNGLVSSGLKNRRKDETMLWNGTYNELYSYYLRNSFDINVVLLGILIIGSTIYFRRRFKK
jgi:GH24 family phage-related lysozyme (muramidase)